jgi:hypothetical protein
VTVFERFSGLPVHVLVIHAVVILVPVSAVGVLALALGPGGGAPTARW